jgi:Zn-finger nucleic acid-binding protein
MLHLCPKCKVPTLAPFSVHRQPPRSEASPVPPSRCSTCDGVWMPHGALALEIRPPEGPAPAATGETPTPASGDNPDARVGFCPAGHGLLIRAKVETSRPFYLDRCGTCAGIWFDAGEWAALAATEWLHHVDDLWDPVFRRRLREERARKQQIEALEQALGAEAARKVVDLAGELKKHPHRSIAMAFLIDEVREG